MPVMNNEFDEAEDLLDRAGLLDAKLPIPLDSIIEYLAKDGLELHYYDPKLAPEAIKNAAYGVDEVLHWKDGTAALFINRKRPWTRQRFSICHGIGHFILPAHRNLDYLTRGCNTMRPLTTKPYERQADRFAAGLNMPPSRFRRDMLELPFNMVTIHELARLYSASAESAAIHYMQLADIPCALVRLERIKGNSGLRSFSSPLRVRYQLSNALFPFRIQPGTIFQEFPDKILSWKNHENQYMPEGMIKGDRFGLGLEENFQAYSCYADEFGGVIALVYPGNIEPSYVVDKSRLF